ncbi:protein lifeguard 3-like [Bombus affinis]|uniref:protein lifeguard 3-like n=1 Tax=Bombus affinis TaxID=309941 RepID=UPI0021B7CB6C|nr:protein lifeguard 3-like [Bombus affinis]
MEENQEAQKFIPGPPQLPPLYKGQKIKTGPYTTTVTDEMVTQRERENEQLYRAWREQQRRRAMAPDDDDSEYMGDFKDDTVRRSFIRKIFCILTIQLLFTSGIIAVFLFVDAARKFMIIHWYMWIIAMICFTISFCAISISERARRIPPFNYIWLTKLTLSMSYLAAFVSVFLEVEVILMALGMTTLITLGIGLIATFSKFDLTMRTGLLMIFGLASIVSIFVIMIVLLFTYIRVLHIIISVIGMILLSMYLYFDVQTIMGGRRIELSPDEVVFATAQIYVDIVLLYQYVLLFMARAVLQYKAERKVLDMQVISVPYRYTGRGLARLLTETAFTYVIVNYLYMYLTCEYMQKYYLAIKNPALEEYIVGPPHILEGPNSEPLDPDIIYELPDPEDFLIYSS